MGSSVISQKPTEEVVQKPVCLSSCVYGRYGTHGDAYFMDALCNAEFLQSAVLFYCGKSSDHDLFLNQDVKKLIVSYLLEALVAQRVDKCTRLCRWWRLEPDEHDIFSVKLPDKHTHGWAPFKAHVMEIEGVRYRIPHYFWLDEVYYSIECPCQVVAIRLSLSYGSRENPNY